MRTTTNTSNHNSNVTPYKDYPASNSSTKSQTQLVCLIFFFYIILYYIIIY